MDYEEKYEQAMFRMNKWAEGSEITDPKEVAEFVFPELKESEDEKIREEIIQSIQDNMCVIHKDKCIAWLEKQGEQKSTWSEEDESMLQNILECLKNGWSKLPTDVLKYESWLKSIKERIKGETK